VLRIFEDVLGGSDLDDLAQVHDGDAIGEMLDDAEVMGDEQEARPNSCWRSFRRLMICAWMDTSSDETGSSQTISDGRKASARAILVCA
jgi:hypothetical protein